MTKEEIYDSKINPLMAQIIDICKEHKIAFFASFTIDTEEGLQCTTALLTEDYEPSESLLDAADSLMGRNTSRSPLMLTTRDANGDITKMEAIL